MLGGPEIHDEVDYFLHDVTLDILHDEELLGVVTLHVAPSTLVGMGTVINGLEKHRVTVHTSLVAFHLQQS